MPLDSLEETQIPIGRESALGQHDDSRGKLEAMSSADAEPASLRFANLRRALTRGPMVAVAVYSFLFSLRTVFGHYFVLDGSTYLVLGDDQMISMRYARNLVD